MKQPVWLDEYEQLLHDPSAGAFQRAVELKALHRPQSLFKYRAITDLSLDSLRRGYVWLSHPQTFNDGYDSAIVVDHDRLLATSMRRSLRATVEKHGLSKFLTESDIRAIECSEDPSRALSAAVLPHDPALAGQDLNKMVDALAYARRAVTKDLGQATRELARGSILACSFASSGTTPALWAHYAANGSGFCVEYDLAQLPPDDLRLRLLLPVIYGPAPFDATSIFERFMLNGVDDLTVRWPLLAATYKDQQWSIEQEWRLIDPLGLRVSGRAAPMPMAAVYLGAATRKEDAEEVMSAAKSQRLRIFKMQLGRDASALAFSELEGSPTTACLTPAT